jgi:acetyl esterase/lipase
MKKIVITLLLLVTVSAYAQKTVMLYDGEIPNNIGNGQEERSIDAPYGKVYFQVVNPALEVYLPSREKNTGIAIVICPGGGYAALAYTHEGANVAKRFAEEGIAAFVLKYRLPDPLLVQNKETVPLQDAQRALIMIRENASKWRINPSKVGIMGSSAGGHLASTAGTHFEKCYVLNPNNISVRPDFMLLKYPVISLADSLTHYQSRLRLIGDEAIPPEIMQLGMTDPQKADEMMAAIPVPHDRVLEFSNELHVSANTPPTFIVHANDDVVVPVQNSILFIAALQQAQVEVESFFYAHGGHGFGLDNLAHSVDWTDSFLKWIKKTVN